MRRAGPASRAFGRYAVGLRPILDPDPYLGAPKTSADNPKEDQPRSTAGLTRPRSFRNDKSAKSCHELVSDLGVTYRNPDTVRRKAGEGLAAAYCETVVPQGEADPAGCAINAYAACVDERERGLGPAGHCEPQLRQLVH